MRSHTTARFRQALAELPEGVQRSARRAYVTFKRDPLHPALQFKQIHPVRPIFSARVGLSYRAVGSRESDTIIWFWVGSHAEYDRLVARLRRS